MSVVPILFSGSQPLEKESKNRLHFIEIKDRIQSNPLELKKHLLSDIRDKRELRNEDT
jgi:hypothetical protein